MLCEGERGRESLGIECELHIRSNWLVGSHSDINLLQNIQCLPFGNECYLFVKERCFPIPCDVDHMCMSTILWALETIRMHCNV